MAPSSCRPTTTPPKPPPPSSPAVVRSTSDEHAPEDAAYRLSPVGRWLMAPPWEPLPTGRGYASVWPKPPPPMRTLTTASISISPSSSEEPTLVVYRQKRRRLCSAAEEPPHCSTLASSSLRQQPPSGKILMVYFRFLTGADYVYSLHVLDMARHHPCKSVTPLPDPIMRLGREHNFPHSMGFLIHGRRLYMFGGIHVSAPAGTTDTFYIDFPIRRDVDPLEVIKKGPCMNHGKAFPLVFPINGKFYVLSANLSFSRTFEVFDPEMQVWTSLPDCLCVKNHSKSRELITSFKTDASIIYVSTSSNVYAFDIDENEWTCVDDVGGLPSFPFEDRCADLEGLWLCYNHSWGGVRAFDVDARGFRKPIRVKGGKELKSHDKLVKFFHGNNLFQVDRNRFGCSRTGYDSVLNYYSRRAPKRHFVIDVFDIEMLSGDGNTQLNYKKVAKSVYVLDERLIRPSHLCKAFLLYNNDPDSCTFLQTLNHIE